jgi:hypothetical protein
VPEPVRREALYEGALFLCAATPATLRLVDWTWDCLRSAFPEADPRDVQHHVAGDELFRRLTALRRSLLVHPEVKPLIRSVLESLAFDLDRTYVDLLRLRMVPSGGHRDPAARHAYLVHRDTWYANPEAQVNVWIAVADVAAEEAFAIYTGYWDRPVRNGSARFAYDEWQELGGFQAPDDRKVYPGAEEALGEPGVRVPVRRGEALLFSGTHLHGTAGHDSGRTRLSLEIRTVHADDVARMRRRRRLDNLSRGSALRDYFRAADFTPYPADGPV